MAAVTIGKGVELDLERLLQTRMLIQANSGAGKSWALRRILEQTHGKVQQLVIDPEGEFATLREKFDYVLAARQGGDVVADPRLAKLLAEKLLQIGTCSAVLDIYELKPHERVSFVRLFLEALVEAPKTLWHPALVILDEAHVYAPEQGHAESADAVKSLATRGRKRGFCLIAATQRLSKLHKDVAAECNNKLIGRSSLDVDMKRAADELGFTTKEERLKLRDLDAGQFLAFGPALARTVTLVTVGGVVTTHPKAGSKLAAVVPPPTDKVRALLPQLSDLPAEAEAREQSITDLKRENANLKRELTTARKANPAPKPAKPVVERVEVSILRDGHVTRLEQLADRTGKALLELVACVREARSKAPEAPPPSPPIRVPTVVVHKAPATGPSEWYVPVPPLPPGELATLTAALQYEGLDRKRLSVLTGYKRSSRDAYIARLAGKGLVDVRGAQLFATDAGRAALNGSFEPLPVGSELQEYWRARLPEGERKTLEVLISAHPDPVARESIDEATGYKRSSRDAYLTRLKARGLVEFVARGQVRASEELFA